MADVTRIRAEWTAFTGAPGYSNFYFNGVLAAADLTAVAGRIRAFFSSFAASFPTGLTIRVPGPASFYDLATGLLSGQAPIPVIPSAVVGTNAAAYSGGSGIAVNWITGVVHNGRLLSGRTYLVPAVGVYDTDGTLTAGVMSGIAGNATALIGSGVSQLHVYSRFRPGKGSAIAAVTGSTIHDRAAIMKSRRD